MPVPYKRDVGRILLIQNYASVETASATYLPIKCQFFLHNTIAYIDLTKFPSYVTEAIFLLQCILKNFFLYLLLCIQSGVFNKKINYKLQVYLWIVKMDDILNVYCKLTL